ncbi:MAG: hypothetical protein DHS20C17_20080 [Cyclobacteriaceae bacterium]|nr:MAG: hypothetical protein DHS20C17_20080 [Cyclobacteriaceae bacterium]
MGWAVIILASALFITYYKYKRGDDVRVLYLIDATLAIAVFFLWIYDAELSESDHREVLQQLKDISKKQDDMLGDLKELNKKDQQIVKKVDKENQEFLEDLFNGGYVYFTKKGNRVLMSNPKISANWPDIKFSATLKNGRIQIKVDHLVVNGMTVSNNKFGLTPDAQVRQPIKLGIGGSDWLLGATLIDKSIPNTPIWVVGYWSKKFESN